MWAPTSVSPRRPRVPSADFYERLSKLWSDLPDVLTEQNVARLLGYTANTVGRWISKRRLRTVTAHGETFVAKQWLIDFCREYGFRIVRKSRTHRELEARLITKGPEE